MEINHIFGHIFSTMVERAISDVQLPYVCLTVSGGHNDIYLVDDQPPTDLPEPQPAHKRGHLPLNQPTQR